MTEVIVKRDTFVTLVLDETGSMSTIVDDTIGGYNTFIKGLKDQKGDHDIKFTLIKFDSNKHDIVHRAEPIDSIPELTKETYVPGAATPLIDASMKAIKATEAKVSELGLADKANIVVAIQTDGHENASREFTRDQLVAEIKDKTAKGWLFQFLGAGIDAFASAQSLGINARNTLGYDRDKSNQAFYSITNSVIRKHLTGSSLNAAYTDEERRASSSKWIKNQKEEDKFIVDDITI